MEFGNSELTFDMIGNMSDEEIKTAQAATEEGNITEDNDNEPLFSSGEEDDDNQGPEGVGDESQEDEEDTIPEGGGDSPNFYASIANSLKEDGIFTLDDSDFENITDADSLAALFNKQTNKLLDEKQKRIDEALSNDVPTDVVRQYEGVINYLNSIDEDIVRDETPEAEQLRGQLIVQDYLNKGFTPERANREAKKSFDSGTDIEDALESLKECKEFYTSSYTEEINKSRKSKEDKLKEEKEQSKQIEDKFLKVEEPIKGIKLTENERKKVLNQYTKFIDKDDSNKPLNAVQKYAKDNPVDYQYNINLLYYLTNGFKDLGTVIQKEVKNKTKSSLSKLEGTLRNPSNSIGTGGLDFGNDTSSESYKGISIDLD